MDHWMARWTVLCAHVVAVTASVVAVNSSVIAQTLIEPNSKPKSQTSGLAKSQPALRTKSCSSFGAGFVQIPGTDICIKVGGYVTTEGTVNQGR
jgi:hypothetical protein